MKREHVYSSIIEADNLVASSPQRAASLISEIYRWLIHGGSDNSDLLSLASKPILNDEQIKLVAERVRSDIMRVIRIANFPSSLTSEEIMLILTLIIEASDKEIYLTDVYNLRIDSGLEGAINELRDVMNNPSLRHKFDQELRRLLKNNIYSEPEYFNKLIYG